jgi:hypothetical protein
VSHREAAATRRLRAPQPSPGSGRFTRDLTKVFAEVRLIREAASQRNVAQGSVRIQHVLGSQLKASPDHERVR